ELQVLPDGLRVTEIMMGLKQAVEVRLRGRTADLGEGERPQLAQAYPQRRRVHRDRRGARAHAKRIRRPAAHGGQLDVPGALERPHQAAAYHRARLAVRLSPIPSVTERFRERPPALRGVGRDEFADKVHVGRRDSTTAIAQERFHGATNYHPRSWNASPGGQRSSAFAYQAALVSGRHSATP